MRAPTTLGGFPLIPALILPRSSIRTSPSVMSLAPVTRPGVSASVDAFRRILRALRLAARRTHATAGISAAQLFVLQVLGDGADASLTQIAARTMTDRTSVAAVVERLVDAGLVSRAPSAEDRRRASIRITARGRSVLRRAPVSPTALLVAGLEGLEHRKLASLADGLAALTAGMGLSEQRAGMLFDEAEGAMRRPTPRPRATRR